MPLTITDEVLEQFRRTWDEFRDIVRKMPDEAWGTGPLDYLVPARLAYHILRFANMYASNEHYTVYNAAPQYQLQGEFEAPLADLPTREQVLANISQTEATVKQWLLGLGDGGLAQPEDKYPWTASMPIGRAMYGLRHIMWHVGELNALLRIRGYGQGEW
jgi:hypothetical protein